MATLSQKIVFLVKVTFRKQSHNDNNISVVKGSGSICEIPKYISDVLGWLAHLGISNTTM